MPTPTKLLNSPATYVPFNYTLGGIPLIVYVMKSHVPLKELLPDRAALTAHLERLYERQDERLQRGSYHVVFVWNWEGLLMTDVWMYQTSMLNPEGGDTYLEACVPFKGLHQYAPIGLASERSVMILGREQEHRWKFATLADYLDRTKSLPDFPGSMKPTETY